MIAPRFSSSSMAAGTLWMTMMGWPKTLRWMRSESGVCALGTKLRVGRRVKAALIKIAG